MASQRFIEGSLPCLTALALGKPLTLLPQTYGPFRSRSAVFLARQILTRSATAYSRDQESINRISQMFAGGNRRPRVMFCPDVAFTLETRPTPPDMVDPPLPGSDSYPVNRPQHERTPLYGRLLSRQHVRPRLGLQEPHPFARGAAARPHQSAYRHRPPRVRRKR